MRPGRNARYATPQYRYSKTTLNYVLVDPTGCPATDAVKSGSYTVLTHYRPGVEIERWDVLASETQQ